MDPFGDPFACTACEKLLFLTEMSMPAKAGTARIILQPTSQRRGVPTLVLTPSVAAATVTDGLRHAGLWQPALLPSPRCEEPANSRQNIARVTSAALPFAAWGSSA